MFFSCYVCGYSGCTPLLPGLNPCLRETRLQLMSHAFRQPVHLALGGFIITSSGRCVTTKAGCSYAELWQNFNTLLASQSSCQLASAGDVCWASLQNICWRTNWEGSAADLYEASKLQQHSKTAISLKTCYSSSFCMACCLTWDQGFRASRCGDFTVLGSEGLFGCTLAHGGCGIMFAETRWDVGACRECLKTIRAVFRLNSRCSARWRNIQLAVVPTC